MASNSKHDVWCKNCGCLMKLRKGKYGTFYGCSGYPVCKNTMNLRDAQLRIDVETGADTMIDVDDPYYDDGDGYVVELTDKGPRRIR